MYYDIIYNKKYIEIYHEGTSLLFIVSLHSRRDIDHDEETIFLGSPVHEELSDQERNAVNSFLCRRGKSPILPGSKVPKFFRAKHNGQVYHSREYTRVTARNSFTISFSNESRRNQTKFGQVQFYIQQKNDDLAMVELLTPTDNTPLSSPSAECVDPVSVTLSRHFTRDGIFHKHLPMATRVEKSKEIVAIEVSTITRKNVFVEAGSDTFVSIIPNFFECD